MTSPSRRNGQPSLGQHGLRRDGVADHYNEGSVTTHRHAQLPSLRQPILYPTRSPRGHRLAAPGLLALRRGDSHSGIPIDPSTGNVTGLRDGLHHFRQNPLSFSRYYNASTRPPPIAGTMGTQWRTPYDRYLQVAPRTVIAERPNGDQITFTLVGSYGPRPPMLI